MSTSRDDFGIALRSALLKKGARQKFSLFFLIIFATIIFFLDFYKLKPINITRAVISDGIYKTSNIATAPIKAFSSIKNNAIELFITFKENKVLRDELEDLKRKEFQVEYLKNQNENLRKILEADSKILGESTLAKVLLDKKSPYLKSIIINRGSRAGVSKGMPVLDGNYLVGRVVEVNYLSSRVLLLNDLNSRIPITFGKNSIQAILTGKGGNNPQLEYLPEFFTPEGNSTVYTSGKDGVLNAGLPVGKTIFEKEKVFVKMFSDPNQLSFVTVQLSDASEENF
ncbi:MAG: rod shape-determining protein MreC [Candidatus Pelagibacter sp.]|nr:rod shape-determining protein MreC [Candidatus Pelagibacter sp.]OUW23681.1 MAG: rod shape-determining protein MreC [Rickettsiales bacterium TMED174]|tara:strand:- start:815 stop:1666 length:852 start_codon:yes stop_codon:yes gene_type:complete